MSEKERWLWIDYARVANQRIEKDREYVADRLARAKYFRPKPTDKVRPICFIN